MTTPVIRHRLRPVLAACVLGIVLLAPVTPAAALGPQYCKSRIATIVGTNSAETLEGTSGADVIVGLGGDDLIRGNDGNDVICGDADQPSGADGNDRLLGGDGHDTVDGGPGRDRVHGGSGNDRLYGGSGKDILSGVDGTDRLFGSGGDDQLNGGSGDDRLDGGPGINGCDGGAGADNGVKCDVDKDVSIALPHFKTVSLRQLVAALDLCVLQTTISNTGSEQAQGVALEASVDGVAFPFYSAELDLQGPSEIVAAGEAHYFRQLPFTFAPGDPLRYSAKLYSAGTLIDTAGDPFGIKCLAVGA